MENDELVEYAKILLVAEKHTCKKCGHEATEYEQLDENPVTYGPDPYSMDIHNDFTEYWQCNECAYESAMDI